MSRLHGPHIITGLDIGTTKICAIIGEYDPESCSYKILGKGTSVSQGMKRGVVIDIEETKKSVISAVAEAEKQSGITINAVTVGIAGDHIRSLGTSSTIAISHKTSGGSGAVSPVDQTDLDRALESAKNINLGVDREIIHVIPQEYYVDDQMGVKNPIQMHGSRLKLNAHIVTAALNNVKNLIRSVQSTGLNVLGIVLEPLASSEAVLSADQRELGTALIDIGGGTTDISVFQEGYIKHTGVVGKGGAAITRDIASILQTTFKEAERIKREYSWASSNLAARAGAKKIIFKSLNDEKQYVFNSVQLSQYVEARAEELLYNVREEILKATELQNLHGGMVFTGGGARLKGLCQMSETIFQIPAQIGNPTRLPGLEEKGFGPEYSTAVGLLKWAKENSKKQASFSRKEPDSKMWKKIKNIISDMVNNFF